ncbi:MAG: hypothetical protein IJ222_03410 [Bacteroidales bacterium]|nr:hypothetical protein [Bacteroidales bacterium]
MSEKQIILEDADREALVTLGGLRWSEDKIAAYFGWDRAALHKELSNPESEISKLILRGELRSAFKLESRLQADAEGGNLTAAKQFSDLMRDRSFKMSKLDLFGGAEDVSLFESVQKYIEAGSPGNMSAKEQLYIELLQIVYSLSVKFGDRKTLKLLAREPFSLSYAQSKEIICEAVELFNGGRQTSKEAMRHHIAQTYDTLYHAVIDNAKTTQDYALAAGILDKKVKILKLDQPDVERLPAELYHKPFIVRTMEPASLGLPAANRDRLAEQIDSLDDIPERDKRSIAMDAGIIDYDLSEKLHYASEETHQD